MAFFNETLTSGIQDISALLPLLGTEQVERHIGSALQMGLLYAGASPLSLFGSLGAVKAAFSIVVSCIAWPLGQRNRSGAKWLSDAGFSAQGDVACLISSQASHDRNVLKRTADTSGVYLAEAKLERVLNLLHIDDGDRLRADLSPGQRGSALLRWNLNLIATSILSAAGGLLPYVYLTSHSDRMADGLSPWTFPVMRVAGSAAISVCSQLMIQLRLLQIIRCYLVYRYLSKCFPDDPRVKLAGKAGPRNADEWLYHLRRADAAHSKIDNKRIRLEENNHYLPCFARLKLFVIGVLMFVGGVSCIIGYVGSFTVVQSANNGTGPLIWLGLEAGLSVLRTLLWGLNPENDDHSGFVFHLDVSPNECFLTSNISQEEIDDDHILPVTHSDTFLRSLASHVGPFESLSKLPEGIAVYYSLLGTIVPQSAHLGPTGAANSHLAAREHLLEAHNRDGADKHQHEVDAMPEARPEHNVSGGKILYIVLYDYKEHAANIAFKLPQREYLTLKEGSWHSKPSPYVILGEHVQPADNRLLQDKTFFMALEDHCNRLYIELKKISCRGNDTRDTVSVMRYDQFKGILKAEERDPGLDNVQKRGTIPSSAPHRIEVYLDWTLTHVSLRDRAQVKRQLTLSYIANLISRMVHSFFRVQELEIPSKPDVQPDVEMQPEPENQPEPETQHVPELRELCPLSSSDIHFLNFGVKERLARNNNWYFQLWATAHMSLIRDELLLERSPEYRENMLLAEKMEVAVVERLLMTEGVGIEIAVARSFALQEIALSDMSAKMIEAVGLTRGKEFERGGEKEWESLKQDLVRRSREAQYARLELIMDASLCRLSHQREAGKQRTTSQDNPSTNKSAVTRGWHRESHGKPVRKFWQDLERSYNPKNPPTDAPEILDALAKFYHDDFETLIADGYKALKTMKGDEETLAENKYVFENTIRRCRNRWESMVHRLGALGVKVIGGASFSAVPRELAIGGLRDLIVSEVAQSVRKTDKDSVTDYLSNPLVRLVNSKSTRFLALSEKKVGSVQLAMKLLEFNQITEVVDMRATVYAALALEPVDFRRIKNLVHACKHDNRFISGGSVKLVKHYTVFDNSESLLSYEGIRVVDYYRTGNPYLLFGLCGMSKARLRFEVFPGKEEKNVLLNHAHTDTSGVMSMTISRAPPETGKTRKAIFSGKDLAYHNFQFQIVELPTLEPGKYILTFTLGQCDALHWLDSIMIADRDEAKYIWKAYDKTLKVDKNGWIEGV